MDRLITAVQKNKTEEIRFSLRRLNGKDFLDIREFTELHGLSEKIATGRGITVSLVLFDEFKKAMSETEAALPAGRVS